MLNSERVENITIQFDNDKALQKATALRVEDDYHPSSLSLSQYLLPVNVLRELANKMSVDGLRDVAEKTNTPDLHLAIIRHRITSVGISYQIPLHFCTAFTFPLSKNQDSARIAGPVFVSSLHSILESQDLQVDQKVDVTKGILTEYLASTNNYDMTIIQMPKRKYLDHSFDIKTENSLTHTLLLRATKDVKYYFETENSGIYFLSHRGEDNEFKRKYLFNNDNFLNILISIASVWSANFKREIALCASDELSGNQKKEVIKVIVDAYSNSAH